MDARRGGIVTFWDWGTGETLRRVGVRATNESFVQAPCADGPRRFIG